MTSTHIPAIELLANAVIRILAAYFLVYALTRLTSRASARHILWLIFVIATSCYWLATARQISRAHAMADSRAGTAVEAIGQVSPTLTTVTIPTKWSRGVELGITLVAWLYFLGAAAMVLRIFRRRVKLRGVIAQAQQVSPQLADIFEQERRRLGISRCQILEMPGLHSPGTAYAWNPVVILPEGIDAFLDDEQLVDVLCHELTHVKRLDFLWSAFADLAGSLLFFHPAIWLALRNLARDRELACDLAVMESRRGRTRDYALCLTRLARRQVAAIQLESPNHLALLDSFLALRVKALLAERRRRNRMIRVADSTLAAGALCLFAAGWSSLAFAVLVEGAAPRVIAAVPSVVHRGAVRTRARRTGGAILTPSAEIAPADQSASEPDHAEPPAARPFSPVDPSLDRESGDYAGSDSVNSTSPKNARRSSDDRSPPTQAQNSPSWQTAANAAAGALARIAHAKKDNDGDADDRASRPF